MNELSHPWFYINKQGEKQNFQCDDSIRIEIVYQIYNIALQEKDRQKQEDRGLTNVKLKDYSIVNIQDLEITYDDGFKSKIQRGIEGDKYKLIRNYVQKDVLQNFDFQVNQNNQRFSERIYNKTNNFLLFTQELKNEDEQWLGWNWIKAKYGLSIYEKEENQKSQIQIFVEMLNEGFVYFPSLFEIQQGIFQAFQQHQIQKLETIESVDKKLKLIKDLNLEYYQTWQIFFQNKLNTKNDKKPLCHKILEDPTNPITKFLVYLHSMQTFLFQDLKIASRQKDQSKIMTLGPYALCLSYILSKAKCKKDQEILLVYRGMTMLKKVFDEQFCQDNESDNNNEPKLNQIITPCSHKKLTSQKGFQSTSRNKDLALEFADPTYLNTDYVGVLLKIELRKNENYFIYDEETSAFPREEEVLLQEGLEFTIISVSTKIDEMKQFEYKEVHLIY